MSLIRTFAVAALLASPAAAQSDPFASRVRGLTDRSYPSFQGFDCTTVQAPREVVFRILASPDRAAQILLAGIPNVVPHGASYRKSATATKGEVLTLTADTLTGSRKIEMSVVAVVPGHLLSLVVTRDDEVLAKDVTELFDTFALESNADGTTDVYWANHYDPSSPFMAALGPLAARRFRVRRETGLLILEGLGRASSEKDARSK